MSLQVALVAGGVVAVRAPEVLLPAVHRQVALEQRLAAEAAAAVGAGVAVVVEDHDVLAQGGLRVELHSAALQDLSAKERGSGSGYWPRGLFVGWLVA